MSNKRRLKKTSRSHLSDLDSLRSHLGIAPINTGRQYPLTTSAGLVTDDLEGLHAMSDEGGRIILQSGVELKAPVKVGMDRAVKVRHMVKASDQP